MYLITISVATTGEQWIQYYSLHEPSDWTCNALSTLGLSMTITEERPQ